MYYVAGQAVTVTIEFKVGGEFIVPTAGTIFYSLLGPDGSAYGSHSNVALTVPGTSYQLTLPQAVNTKTRTIEGRYVVVKFDYAGRTYEIQIPYRLTDRLLHSVTFDRVRALLGVNDRELPDDNIDLVDAYYKTKTAVGSTFNTVLQDSPVETNTAIACAAAVEAIPSLQLAIAQEEGTDSSNYKRISDVDFDKLLVSISQRYAQLVQQVAGAVATTPTLAVLATPTDAITGA